MLLTCIECGTVFEGFGNTKYCCAECRAEGKAKANKAWLSNPEVKKRRAERRKLNQEKLVGQPTNNNCVQDKPNAPRADERRAERLAILSENRKRELEERAQAGEYHAIRLLNNNMSVEYWRAFKNQEIEKCDKLNKLSKCEVNGISVYVDNFESILLESIKESGIITVYR